MRIISTTLYTLLFIFIAISSVVSVNAKEEKYTYVVEESYYVVKAENKEKFLNINKEKLYPFWIEMEKMGIIVGDFRMYSQRLHTLKPLWTFKTVVIFPNYQALDKWLEIRDEVYEKLYPGAGGYKAPRKEIDLIVEDHWDEFIRQVPMK